MTTWKPGGADTLVMQRALSGYECGNPGLVTTADGLKPNSLPKVMFLLHVSSRLGVACVLMSLESTAAISTY
jgi:hypothetical protein